jgi:hypothetical protein
MAAEAQEPVMLPSERRRFVAGLGVAQIISWGTLYYAFPVIAVAMEGDLHVSKPELYGAATFGLAVGSLAAYPVGVSIDRGHGRMVLALGSALAAALLFAWSRVMSLAPFYAIFAGIGLVEAMTLYDAACAVITRRATGDARAAITAIKNPESRQDGGVACDIAASTRPLVMANADLRPQPRRAGARGWCA